MKPDTLTSASVTTAWVVVANKPFYPVYVWWLTGLDAARASLWTLAAWPLFAALPWLARRSPLGARAGLPLVGAADSTFATYMFGEGSGVEAFLVPCAMLAALSFRAEEARISWALTSLVFLAFAALRYAAPAGVSPLPAGLPLVGAADSAFATYMFGEGSGVESFLVPCAMLAALSFRASEARISWALTSLVYIAFAALRLAAPAGVSPLPGGLLNLNLFSAASLTAFIGLRFASAR